MGKLNLLITGAGGYIGRHAVAEAQKRGHVVTALVRSQSSSPSSWAEDPGVTVLACDLSVANDGLVQACDAADVVIHCAASMSGDPQAHARDTIQATEVLLAALPKEAKLVHLSSIAVYGLEDLSADDQLTEANALETQPEFRDAYAAAKLAQENLINQAAGECGLKLTTLRAGAVFGPERLWNAHLGPSAGPVLVRMESHGTLPLCHISTCAAALIEAAERPATNPINLIDEDLPNRARFLACLSNGPRLVVPFNWRLVMPVARLLSFLGLNSALPGLLRPSVLRSRFLPLHYDNSRMRSELGLRQPHGFEALMHEAQS